MSKAHSQEDAITLHVYLQYKDYIKKMSGKGDQSEGLHHRQIAIQYNPPDHILSFLDE